jgi:hypothetical protein
MSAVLAHDEAGTGLVPALDNDSRTEVAVGDPQLLRLRTLQQRPRHRTLLGVGILARHDVRHQPAVGVVHHQRVARQRRTPVAPQGRQALLAGRQMIAVEHPQLPSRQARREAQRFDHRQQSLCTLLHQPTQDRRLGASHLVVQRRNRYRQLHCLLRRRVQRGPQPQRHQRGELDHRRKQQFAWVLPLAGLLEHLVDPACGHGVFQRQAHHHAQRGMCFKAGEDLFEHRLCSCRPCRLRSLPDASARP